MTVSGKCTVRLFGAPHQPGCALRCVRKDGHEGAHWFKRSKPTESMVAMLMDAAIGADTANPVLDGLIGMRRGERATVRALRERGMLALIYKRDGAHELKPTKRGRALLAGEDVR